MAIDWMHCHHLGWLQYLFGSVIHFLVLYLLPDEHWQLFERAPKDQQVQNSLQDEVGQAHNVSGLHAAMLALWSAHMDPTDAHHRRVRLMWVLKKKYKNIRTPTGNFPGIQKQLTIFIPWCRNDHSHHKHHVQNQLRVARISWKTNGPGFCDRWNLEKFIEIIGPRWWV